MTKTHEAALPIYTEIMPAGLAELPAWMDAIGARIHLRLQDTPGARPNSEMLALAVQDIQYTLSGEGDDPTHLRESLPEMTSRAQAHPQAREFVMFTAPEGQYAGARRGVPLEGIQTFAAPLIKDANARIKKSGALAHNYDFLEQIAETKQPSLFFRCISHLAMPKTRSLLFETVLGFEDQQ
jgi:hypothetical protein